MIERVLRDIYYANNYISDYRGRTIDLRKETTEVMNNKGENIVNDNQGSFEKWWEKSKKQFNIEIDKSFYEYYLPEINFGECDDDTWSKVSWVPSSRSNHVAVWTGSEMIIWSGLDEQSNYLNSGAKYDPATDSWQPIAIMNSPSGRINATAVWTGTEMIVWGGNDAMDFFKTGGRYNPITDEWTSISISNAPSKRIWHAAVWTGNEMIIWGGYYTDGSYDYFYNDGARYNPVSNSWVQISTYNAPTARCLHSFVWTDEEMLVWGGYSGLNFEGDGGRYNPISDTWLPISTDNAPSARWRHTAVWTGTEMIVWGGQDDNGDFVNTGGKYNPTNDSWSNTSTENAPDGRYRHTAIWTNSVMIIWGGFNGALPETAGKYDPISDS